MIHLYNIYIFNCLVPNTKSSRLQIGYLLRFDSEELGRDTRMHCCWCHKRRQGIRQLRAGGFGVVEESRPAAKLFLATIFNKIENTYNCSKNTIK
jgi:hypothetical protein